MPPKVICLTAKECHGSGPLVSSLNEFMDYVCAIGGGDVGLVVHGTQGAICEDGLACKKKITRTQFCTSLGDLRNCHVTNLTLIACCAANSAEGCAFLQAAANCLGVPVSGYTGTGGIQAGKFVTFGRCRTAQPNAPACSP
jgi:hypothetical protein